MNYRLQELFEKRWVKRTGIALLIIILILLFWLGISDRNRIGAIEKKELKQEDSLRGLFNAQNEIINSHGDYINFLDSCRRADSLFNIKLEEMALDIKKLTKKSSVNYYYTTVQSPKPAPAPALDNSSSSSVSHNYSNNTSNNTTNITNENEETIEEQVVEEEAEEPE